MNLVLFRDGKRFGYERVLTFLNWAARPPPLSIPSVPASAQSKPEQARPTNPPVVPDHQTLPPATLACPTLKTQPQDITRDQNLKLKTSRIAQPQLIDPCSETTQIYYDQSTVSQFSASCMLLKSDKKSWC